MTTTSEERTAIRRPTTVVLILVGSAVAFVSFPQSARAVIPDYPASSECQYPTTVAIRMQTSDEWRSMTGSNTVDTMCTAVYVGDGIILTASHCVAMNENFSVVAGEDIDDPEIEYTGVTCVAHPDFYWEQRSDIFGNEYWAGVGADTAYCDLQSSPEFNEGPTAVVRLPLTPLMPPTGCEPLYLRSEVFPDGAPVGNGALGPFSGEPAVTSVGMGAEQHVPFGQGLDGIDFGTKRHIDDVILRTETQHLGTHKIQVLHSTPDVPRGVQPGDSGGPVLFEMPDGTSRVIGVHSGGPSLAFRIWDANEGDYVDRNGIYADSSPRHMRWVEWSASNGRPSGTDADISPCYDWDFQQGQYLYRWNSACEQNYDRAVGLSNGDWQGASACTTLTGGADSPCAGWDPPPVTDVWETEPVHPFYWWDQYALYGPDATWSLRYVEFDLNGSAVFGGAADDVVRLSRSGGGAYAGGGDDAVFGSPQADLLVGSGGDDLLVGSYGQDRLVPGRGMDYVDAGPGDDIIYLLGECELFPGEGIDGGDGYDVVFSPYDESELAGLGVELFNIEEVRLIHSGVSEEACSDDSDIAFYPL